MAIHTCENCNQPFTCTTFAKYCPECRFKCQNCGKTKKHYGRYCDACRTKLGKKKPAKTKCKFPGCDKMLQRRPSSSGYCMLHTQGRQHSSEAVKAHNQKRHKVTQKIDLEQFGHKESRIAYILQICDVCQSAYLVSLDTYMRDSVKCCSPQCLGVYATKCNLKQVSDTAIELAIEEELIKQGYSYQKQVPLCGITTVDFLLTDHNIVIYCDGDYWHNLPDAQTRDKKQVETLKAAGYKVYRFWEKDIRKSPKSCMEAIDIPKSPLPALTLAQVSR